MKERGILFSAPMVRAILEGRKTQTRRLVKPQPGYSGIAKAIYELHPFAPSMFKGTPAQGLKIAPEDNVWLWEDWCGTIVGVLGKCPYGAIGDRLWVREEFYQFGHWEPKLDREGKIAKGKSGRARWRFAPRDHAIRFDPPEVFRKGRHNKDPETDAWHKRLARFMPRSASRLTLEITEVRVQRLQEISEEDAKAEGVIAWGLLETSSIRGCFKALWQSIHSHDSWENNPWVFAISFRPIR